MKTHVARAKRYAREVAAGKRVAGKWTRLACQRFLDDLKRKDLEFRPKAAERACRFMEQFSHVKGAWARGGSKIVLEPWQSFVVVNIFGWYKDGVRRFSECYLRIARKNGKSMLGALIGLYMFVADGEFGAEVYSGATSEKQAWMVFRPAKMMATRHPEFVGHFGVEINAKNMNCPSDDSMFEPVIGKPGDGASPHCWILDEFHEHKTWDQYGSAVTGMGAREQPLLLIITTAGVDISSPCFEKDDECKKILQGSIDGDSVFALMFCADDDDDWQSVAAMKKANPNLEVSVSRRYLDRQLESARRTPQAAADYKTKNLNQWVSSGSAFLNMLAWARCGDSSLTIDEVAKGRRCMFGLDLASTVDFVALCMLFFEEIEGNLQYWPFWRFWLPEARLDDDKTGNYRSWADAGLIELHDDEEIDLALVRAAISEEALKWEPAEVAYDPWRAAGIEQTLSNEGLLMVKIPQTIAHFTAPMNELEAAHLAGRIHHPNHKVANWMASNLVAKTDTNGNKKPRREIVQNKIDGMVSMLMAMNRSMLSTEGPSVYETRGLAG